ncbi:MAG: hypothetical protein WCX90_08935 [Thiohalomonadaceae bacterium]
MKMSLLPWTWSFEVLTSSTGLVLFLVLLPTTLVFVLLLLLRRRRQIKNDSRNNRHNQPDYDERD